MMMAVPLPSTHGPSLRRSQRLRTRDQQQTHQLKTRPRHTPPQPPPSPRSLRALKRQRLEPGTDVDLADALLPPKRKQSSAKKADRSNATPKPSSPPPSPPSPSSSVLPQPLLQRIGPSIPPTSDPDLSPSVLFSDFSADLFASALNSSTSPDGLPLVAAIAGEESPKRRCENIWKLACKRRVGLLYEQYTPQTIRAVVAAQAESESLFNTSRFGSDGSDDSDSDEDDEMEDVDLTAFTTHGFANFSIDLDPSTPSTSTSPPQPHSNDPSPSTPPSPITLFSCSTPSLPFPPPPLSSLPVIGLPDAEPGPRYMGRGTPVDRRRRGDWSGKFHSEDGGVDSGRLPRRKRSESWAGFSFDVGGPGGVRGRSPERCIGLGDGDSEWGAFLDSLLGMGACGSGASPSDTGIENAMNIDIDSANGGGDPERMNWFELELGLVPTTAGVPASIPTPEEGFEGQATSTLSFALG